MERATGRQPRHIGGLARDVVQSLGLVPQHWDRPQQGFGIGMGGLSKDLLLRTRFHH
jgi:hypothetical protein